MSYIYSACRQVETQALSDHERNSTSLRQEHTTCQRLGSWEGFLGCSSSVRLSISHWGLINRGAKCVWTSRARRNAAPPRARTSRRQCRRPKTMPVPILCTVKQRDSCVARHHQHG